ncbi:MAG: hypothetical protein OEW05_00775 [Candidatus Aminicenantes bacterium]|nr:hypothetical protein [Candidatus Aminicenantes bacterium]
MRPERVSLKAAIAVFVLLALVPAGKALEPQTKEEPVDRPTLTADDKKLLQEALRLKQELGDEVWPGLGPAAIPAILYNDGYEFLVGHPSPPDSWLKVEDDGFAGQPYYRRAADDPQAFAVRVGEEWAGSMSTLDRMNRKAPFKIAADFYVVLILHEMFHAFQAREAPARFRRALALYALEKNYPAKDPGFVKAWNTEGALLAAALKSQNREELLKTTREFLRNRRDRRAQVPLSAGIADYEREMEWLEGLAKYAELRFYELAASSSAATATISYRPGLPYWSQDFMRLERLMGTQEGDLRFYLSGLAQARILDRLKPEWKQRFLQDGGSMEDLITRTSDYPRD